MPVTWEYNRNLSSLNAGNDGSGNVFTENGTERILRLLFPAALQYGSVKRATSAESGSHFILWDEASTLWIHAFERKIPELENWFTRRDPQWLENDVSTDGAFRIEH